MCNLFIERFCRLRRSQEGARWLTGKWKSDLRFVVMPIFNFLSAFTEMTWFAQDSSLLLLVSYSSCLPHPSFACLSFCLSIHSTQIHRAFKRVSNSFHDSERLYKWEDELSREDFPNTAQNDSQGICGFLDPSKKENDAMSQFFVNEQCYTFSFLLQIEGKTKFQANSTTPRLYYLFFCAIIS